MESSRSSGRQSEKTLAETPCDSKAEFEHIAERLAFAGLRVLRMTCDTQEHARYRLGGTSPLIGYRPRSLVGSSEVTAFPAGWKGWPGTRTPTMDQTEEGRACASVFCPRPMHSFNRRSSAWDRAPLRRRGSTSCG